MGNQERYTLSYRATEVSQVMSWIKAGQCGCLIGLRGAGKSNFLRFLLRKDVRQRCLGRGYANVVFVHIDLLSLAGRSNWFIYELILDRLVAQLGILGVKGKNRKAIASLYQETAHSQNPLIAQRSVERCISLLLKRPTQRLVLLFDEFDAVFGSVDPSLFRSLRALRDAHKGQLSYIVVVASDLTYLQSDLAEVEHFRRLVGRNVCGLGPYLEADARQMIKYLADQRSLKLTPEDTACLIEHCGGHAALLKATLSLLWDKPHGLSIKELALSLVNEPVIQAECQQIWESLPDLERDALYTLVNGSRPKPDVFRHLKRKGLVDEGSSPPLFSTLFIEFIRRQLPSPTRGVHVDYISREAWVEGQLIKTLTELEFEMLCHLYNHRGQLCIKDDLIKNVYRQRYGDMKGGVTDQTLQTLIGRVRKKIRAISRRPGYIVTVRGQGYKLVEPVEK